MLTETIIEAKKADWTIPQHWERFTPAEHRRLGPALRPPAGGAEGTGGRATSSAASTCCGCRRPGIPDFDELNERLFARTGWTVVSVPGLVPGRRLLRASRASAASRPAISSAPPTASTISSSPTSSTTCSAMSRCSPSPRSPISCRRWAPRGWRRSRRARCTGWRGSTGTASNSAWRWRTARPASTAPACCPASARAASRWTSPEPRRVAASTSGRCCAPATARTPSSRPIS